jgi:DNA-binding beta-propeller fold protein YncE
MGKMFSNRFYSIQNGKLLPFLLGVVFMTITFEGLAQYEYDVSKAVYAGDAEKFSLAAQETGPYGMSFNAGGTKMFVIGQNRFIYEYNLSTGFDVSTAIYAGDVERFNVLPWASSPRTVIFNNTGTKLYVLDYGSDEIYEFNLAAPYDVSTATFGQQKDTQPQSLYPFSMAFSTDGSKMYVVEFLNEDIIEFTLSTPFDISTVSHTHTLSISAVDALPYSLKFTPDGTKMFLLGQQRDAISQYSLSTPFDLSTASYDGNSERFSVINQDNQAASMAFNADGTKLFVMGRAGDDINEYDLTNFAPVVPLCSRNI